MACHVTRRAVVAGEYHTSHHSSWEIFSLVGIKKERKKTDNPREGWEDGTPPPHRDFKERGVVR